MEKFGPLSSVFVHLTFMIRSVPLASQGLVNEPIPFELTGQSWWGSGAAPGAALAALAVALADGRAEGVALALAGGADFDSSLEHPKTMAAINNPTSVRIETPRA